VTMTRTIGAFLLGAALVCVARVSAAQVATSSAPQTVTLSAYIPPTPASVLATGASGASDATVLSPYAASMPLRLTLLSSLFPVGPALGTGGCAEAAIETGGTIFPVQPYTSLAVTPRLVLHGFSDLGCPGDPRALLDTGAGGGVTYVVPVGSNLSLVASGGTYGVPGNGGLPWRFAGYGGLDLVKQLKQGRTMYTGVGVISTSRGLRVMNRIGATF
jgi:hypothetical protein